MVTFAHHSHFTRQSQSVKISIWISKSRDVSWRKLRANGQNCTAGQRNSVMFPEETPTPTDQVSVGTVAIPSENHNN